MAELEDSYWDDDDLDAIPGDQLAELEHNAVQFTQQQAQGARPQSSSNYGDDFEDDDLDDAIVYDGLREAPPVQLNTAQSRTFGLASQQEQFRVNRYGGSANVIALVNGSTNGNWQPSAPSRSIPSRATTVVRASKDVKPSSSSSNTLDIDVDALQRQVQELLSAQQSLQQELSIKAGENAIIRSKQEKQAREHERELATIRKVNAERLAHQQKAIEAARDAEKTRATELEFVKKDLFEEAEKLRSLRRAKGKDKPALVEPLATPKKRSAGHRDGFNDDEIQIISPSKGAGRKSNGGTPTKVNNKRKRKGGESPVAVALDVEQDELLEEKPTLPTNAVVLDDAMLERLRRPDDRLTFLEAMLDHAPDGGSLKTMEQLAMLSFLDHKSPSFAATLLGQLASIRQTTAEFPVDFCELIIGLWAECLNQKYYLPIHVLIEYLTFALELKTVAIAPYIAESLLNVAQSTADLIGIPRFKREKYTHLEPHIDVSESLEIMLLVAQGCIGSRDHTVRFWRAMRLEFVLMILSSHQHVRDFDLMLQLLAMSTMKESIGPLAPDQDSQASHVRYIIDRMSLLLVSQPTVNAGEKKNDSSTIAALRLRILHTFEAFCQFRWGGEAVAVHRLAIGRLVKIMSDELDSLYDYRSGHQQSARLVCLSTRILHYLVTKHESSINMQEKLSIIHGGSQKYLIALARLNFAEDDLVLEAGIDTEVAECAHEMLELAVTPEEGEAIHSAFSNG